MITDKHRKFYIDGKLEYALFYNPEVVDKEQIVKDFLESISWKDYSNFYNKKFDKVSFEDNLTVNIKTTLKDKTKKSQERSEKDKNNDSSD